ncbi:MAG: hypothetical protein KDD63_05870 [Bacteroidetes bacterium]|nr:hypothetical protein [Bacteroidota bacterium]
MPLVYKYQIAGKFDEDDDGQITFFFNFDAPGSDFGIETPDTIRHYWELVNFVDERKLNLMAMDKKTGETKPSENKYFVFDWIGEIDTETTLTIDAGVFIGYLNILLNENPNDPVFNIETLKKTKVIKQFIKKKE